MRQIAFFLSLGTFALAQTFDVKDRNGIPVVRVTNIKMFRYSTYFKQEIPEFEASAKNISGEDLGLVPVNATVHKKDGSKVEFSFTLSDCEACDFRKDSTLTASHQFTQPFPYTGGDFDSVEFSFPDSWQSPEDERLDAHEKAKKDAEEDARRKRLVAEQRKKDAELSARMAKARAREEIKAAENRRRIRAACTATYQNTADKKIKDLTVREEQQVRACQALGLYPSE